MTTEAEREMPWTRLGEPRDAGGEVREQAHLLAMNENVDAPSELVVYLYPAQRWTRGEGGGRC